MDGQHHKPRVGKRDQGYHDKVKGFIAFGMPDFLSPFIPVSQRRFITVMAVGDINWLRSQEMTYSLDEFGFVGYPELVRFPGFGKINCRLTAGLYCQQLG